MLSLYAFSDSHGARANDHAIVSVLRRRKPDVLICAGDFTMFGRHGEPLLEECSKLGVTLYAVPGNHERDCFERFAEQFPCLVGLDGRVVMAGPLALAGMAFQDFDRAKDTERAERFLTAIRDSDGDLPRVDIFVSHEPPSGTPLEGITPELPEGQGSSAVRTVIEALSPHTAICGHVHIGPMECQLGTVRVVNPGGKGQWLFV